MVENALYHDSGGGVGWYWYVTSPRSLVCSLGETEIPGRIMPSSLGPFGMLCMMKTFFLMRVMLCTQGSEVSGWEG